MSDSTANEARIFLIPGMAADASVFAAQTAELPGVVVVDWIEPLPRESLSDYAKRMAEHSAIPAGCLLGGASFGGIVAMEMSRYVNPRGVVLIGSIADPKELPRRIRLLRPLAPLIRLAPVRLCQAFVTALNGVWLRRRNRRLSAIARQFCSASPQLLRWSLNAILRWREAPPVDCLVLRVHGDRDPLFPLSALAKRADAVQGGRVVRGGGHVISLSHPQEVNEFLLACLVQVSQCETDK